jgi:type II secretory ATPase GspE/PulE/Tfp pilus assembly ATPase PilB-like protein
MLGEMRDAETAAIGIEAALTGHLVLSTLHTNTAPETITRLLDMGLDPFNFSTAFLGVLAQRLARTLCKKCKEAYTPDEAEYQALVDGYGAERWTRLEVKDRRKLELYRATGCDDCDMSGYRGRIGLHELLIVSDTLRAMIVRKAPVDEVREAAIAEGMATLMQDGIWKVLEGHTDMRQVRAVCMR